MLSKYGLKIVCLGYIYIYIVSGIGNNLGAALKWIAGNAFTESKGDRKDVKNAVVILLTGMNANEENIYILTRLF